MEQKVCIVTGATSGIGVPTARKMAAAGFQTVIVGRNEEKCQAVAKKIELEVPGAKVDYLLADFMEMAQVWKLAIAFREKYSRLDVLINNAGGGFPTFQLTSDKIERTFALNYFAPFLLTNLLLDMMKNSAPARIVNVSSLVHTYAKDIDFEGIRKDLGDFTILKNYARAKLALMLFTKELSRRLIGTGVTVNALHPGLVRSNLGDKEEMLPWMRRLWALFKLLHLGVTPEQGAETSLYLALSSEVEGRSGGYYVNCKSREYSPIVDDESLALQLWKESEKLTGLR